MPIKHSIELDRVLRTLPKLTPDELAEVRKRLEAITSVSAPVMATVDDWLEVCLCEELMRRGVSFGTNWKGRAPKGYRQEAEAVRAFLIKSVRHELSLPEKYALGRVVARALADYLCEVPGFGLKMMLQQINKVPQALDASFPGYAANGKLGMLFKVRNRL